MKMLRFRVVNECDDEKQGLTVPITKLMTGYETIFASLHPFEATVAKLTLAARVKRGKRELQVRWSTLQFALLWVCMRRVVAYQCF